MFDCANEEFETNIEDKNVQAEISSSVAQYFGFPVFKLPPRPDPRFAKKGVFHLLAKDATLNAKPAAARPTLSEESVSNDCDILLEEFGGRCRTRTCDLFHVKETRYQLRQATKSSEASS
jgi:hypothetical protein